jgi:hypothetical protein
LVGEFVEINTTLPKWSCNVCACTLTSADCASSGSWENKFIRDFYPNEAHAAVTWQEQLRPCSGTSRRMSGKRLA